MTDSGYRFCPRCGTALVAGLPFCPKCGLNTAEPGDPTQRIDAGTIDLDPFPPPTPSTPATSPIADTPPARRSADRRVPSTAVIVGVVIVVVTLVVLGLLTRSPAGVDPGAGPVAGSTGQGSSIGPGSSQPGQTAPIVGITIQSPQDGQSVATGEVTVIGLAPPGLSITRDISFGLDQHATVDATGHWAINVRLDQGENTLVFRIGDDRSTETRLRVTYAPPPAS